MPKSERIVVQEIPAGGAKRIDFAVEYKDAQGHWVAADGGWSWGLAVRSSYPTESAGLDLFASSETPLPSHQVVMVGTGTRLAIPNGFFGLLAIRNGGNHATIAEGERIAQLIIVPFTQVALHEVRAFDVTERGEGGFGSTGRG